MNTFKRHSIVTLFLLVISLMFPYSSISQQKVEKVKNVVLVHGAFADGSSWAKVIPILQRKGLNVIAVQNPLTSLEDDVNATKRSIELMEGPVLLVGHSWAGVVITEAGNDPKVKGLLYVCAFTPNDGQSLEDIAKTFPPALGNQEVKVSPSGFLSLSYKGINDYFAQDLPSKERKTIFATQGEWGANCTSAKISNAAWKVKPTWFVVGSNDHMINPELQRSEAKMIKATTIELNSSHVPMVSQPENVAQFIIAAAQKLTVN